jgi:hypothetical protein
MKTSMKKATAKPVMKNGGSMKKSMGGKVAMPKKAMGGKMGKKAC